MTDTSIDKGTIDSDKASKIFIELGGTSYWSKYGAHVLTSLVIIVIILLLYSYVTLKGQITYFKYGKDKDGKPIWNREKCKPHILPISGYLNPEPGYSASESTMRNFKNCASDIFENESAPAFNPITIFVNAVTLLLKSFMNILINIRKAIQGIFDAIISKFKANKRLVVNTQNEATDVITNDIYERLNNSVSQLNNSVKLWTIDNKIGTNDTGNLKDMINLGEKALDWQVIQYYIDYFDIIGLQSIGKAQGAGGKSSNSRQVSRIADATSTEVATRKHNLHQRYVALSGHNMPVLPVYANSNNSYKIDKKYGFFRGSQINYSDSGKKQRAQRQITNGESVSRENLPTDYDRWQTPTNAYHNNLNDTSVIDIARPSYDQLVANWNVIKVQVKAHFNVIEQNFKNICSKAGLNPEHYLPKGEQQKYGEGSVSGHGQNYDPNDFKYHMKYKFKANLDNHSSKKDILTNEEKDFFKDTVAGGNNDIIDQYIKYDLIVESMKNPDSAVYPSWWLFEKNPQKNFSYHLAVNEFYKAFGKKSLIITFKDNVNYGDLEAEYNILKNRSNGWHNKKMVFFRNGMKETFMEKSHPAIFIYDIEWIGREPEVPRYTSEDRAEIWGPLWVENFEKPEDNDEHALLLSKKSKVDTRDNLGSIGSNNKPKYNLWGQASTFGMWRSGVWGSKSVDNEIHLYDRGSLQVKQSDTPTYIDGSVKFKVRKYDIDFYWGWHWGNSSDPARRGVVSTTAQMNYINNRKTFMDMWMGHGGSYRSEKGKPDMPYYNEKNKNWERLTCREQNAKASTIFNIAYYGGMLNYVILKRLHNKIVNTRGKSAQALRRDSLWDGDFRRDKKTYYGTDMTIPGATTFMLRGNNGNQDGWKDGDKNHYIDVFNGAKQEKAENSAGAYWSPEAVGKNGGNSAAYINAFVWDDRKKSNSHAGIWRTPDEDFARMEITHDHITEEYEFKNMALFDPVAMALAGQDACFANCTLFDMINGTTKPIKKVNIGDTLHDGAVVTSTIKSKLPHSQDLYDINNVVVTANHSVEHDGDIISAKDHPNARRKIRARDKTVYCVSTDTKRINQGGTCYTDWDELSNAELAHLNMLSSKDMFSPTDTASIKKSIHVKFDSAFHPNTSFTLDNGEKCHAKHIKIGNRLKTGETITSIVKVNISDMELFKHTICGKTFYGTSNLVYKNGTEEVSTLYQHDREYKQPYTPQRSLRIGYHFNTDCGHITIHQIQFSHYNRGLEILLPNY